MKKEFLKIAVIFFVVLGVVLWGLNFILNKNAPKSKATGETITLSFNPSSVTPAANTDFTVSLLAVPPASTVIRGYKARINFDKAVLKFKSIKYNVGVLSDFLGNSDANADVINANGSILVVGEDQTSTGYTLTSPNGAEIITLTFTAVTANPTVVSINESEFYSVASDATLSNTWMYAVTNLSVNGGEVVPTGGVPVCESFSDDFSGSALNTANWNFINSSDLNGTFTISNGSGQLHLTSSTDSTTKWIALDSKQRFSGDFSAEINFKPINTVSDKNLGQAAFNFNSTNDNRSFRIVRNSGDTKINTVINNNTDNWDNAQNDSFEINLAKDANIRVKLERTGAKVKMSYKLDGEQDFTLVKEFDNFNTGDGFVQIEVANWAPDYPDTTGTFDDFSLTCPTVPTGTPGGGNTGGNTSLDLKLKFQGIVAQPAINSMTARVKIGGCGLTAPTDYQSGTFISDANGVWSGTVGGFDLPACTSGFYTVYVKGQFHVQKKVCDMIPTETAGGTYRCSDGKITLNPGANELDFSGVLQLVGDLPPQNGTVDAYDISLVRNCLGKTDETCLSNADVNRDGKVDTQDYSLIIASLSVKSDEE